MAKLDKAKALLVYTGERMLKDGLVVGTWGNASVRIPKENLMVITPSGIEYGKLHSEDMVVMDLQGNIIEGKYKPSSENALHRAIYRTRPEINAIVHTHSTYATVCAVARTDIPPLVEDLAQVVGGGVKVADYALPGTEDLAKNAVKALEGRNAVLLANHGAVGIGNDMEQALLVCKLVEKAAQIFLLAKILGEPIMLNQEDVRTMYEYYHQHYGQRS